MKKVLLILALSVFGSPVVADHAPGRMFKAKMIPYFDLHLTKELGPPNNPYQINVDSFGLKSTEEKASIKLENFDRFFKHKLNLATIVRKNNKVVYSRFKNKAKRIPSFKGIKSNTLLHGLSMSKTALASAIGSLICSKQIASIDDVMSKYSKSLLKTPYEDVTIRNALQMNSGVTPPGKKDVKKASAMAIGAKQYEGKADLLKAVLLFNKKHREQGTEHNYHGADTFALSLLISDLTGKPASQIFYENVFSKWGSTGLMHWASDKKNRTVALSNLTMSPINWSNFGQYIIDEMKSESCFGSFFKEGLDTAVSTSRSNVKYGFQFWVYQINNQPSITMTGHNGQFNVLNTKNNTVTTVISIDSNYSTGELFGKISEIVSEIN